jgi:hypothetical protein
MRERPKRKVGNIVMPGKHRPEETTPRPVDNGVESSSQTPVEIPRETLDIPGESSLREKLARVPRVTETEFRLACSDIAEELAKSWGFLWRVFLAMAALAAILIGVLGWTIHDMARDEMDKAKVQIDALIAEQFKDEKIQAVIAKVASDKSAELLQQHVEPSIDEFKQHLKDQAVAYDKEVSDVKEEVGKLKARNALTALADDAIENGNTTAYRSLRTTILQPNAPEGAEAEFLRVFETFSILGPTLGPNGKLNVSVIHPGKTKEEELDVSDLLRVLHSPEWGARLDGATLLVSVGKPGSYSTAKALVEVIQNETNLWVTKSLKLAFANIVNYKGISFKDDGSIWSPDGQNVVNWWKDHEAEVARNDSDPKPNPTQPVQAVTPSH